MFSRFFNEENEARERFVERLKERNVSTALLQGHFVEYRDSVQRAVEKAGGLGTPKKTAT